ncbi:patatin-like phospholipase family protein [Ciceribacter sp. L1K23]|uniref:patatin-like phospholipase family protein n=1 Tax=Ciceribacter sp. L1K23 TaxID=2820276 RepID=UPI001B835B69|nr:patatin-like phospholipase family protein [Ciceribacter sp. L1K23]MBR0557484.1 patatin-like phospholipase family protein [Ciceribacter sp. L1K23]
MARNLQTEAALKSVREILSYRLAAGSVNDPYHVALVIEGGGMRAVTAGGMVSALEDMGLTRYFDSVHGSSAGAATGAYFLAGQASFGTSLYYEDINNKDFINVANLFRRRAIMDTAYLVDGAMVEKKPLDFQSLVSARAKLYIATTDIDAATPYIVSDFKDYQHYRSIMKASISMPLIAGSAPTVDGRRLLDGGLLQQIAIDSAISAGATHILALLTRTEKELERALPSLYTKLEAIVLQRLYGGKMFDLYYNRNFSINNHLRQLHAGRTDCGVSAAYISLPVGLDTVSRLTVDRDRLVAAAAMSYDHTAEILSFPVSRDGYHPRRKAA